ncbi:MAG TPA: winged helix-turn-helix domain-containing protein [Bryobacteraceae bacterium]|nr:winged helix-turn-helix domain-containing protein [Bryobacteraceae bacterium]
MPIETRELYEFGDFRLDAARRLVTQLEQPLRLNSKAFETLLVLVRNRRRVVSKDELMQTLWPDTFVEEVNLAQNISAIRKALGETPGENRYIATIPGKGYQFVCQVDEIGAEREGATAEPSPPMAPTSELAAIRPSPTVLARPGARWITWATIGPVLVLGAAGIWWFRHGAATDAAMATPHSVAVLPFQPLAGGSDEEHLGLGMADAVITRLSNIRQLPVRPTDVVIRYGDPAVDPLKAAREMGVDTVLTGRLQKSGDRVRVTVQLVRVADGRPLWAQTFDDQYTSIFQVEDSISEKVAQALALNLGASEKLQLQRHYTDNIDAYRNYLMGRYQEFTFTRDGMNKAIDYFNRAISEDPGYALAYAGLADAWTTESDWLISPREAMPKADAAARKALAFDDQLAEAHGALAHALLHEWKLADSNREFQTALALNPGNVSTYFAYGEYLASVGKADEAIAQGKKALAIDPLSPEINSFLPWDYYLKRDYGNCLASAQRAIQMFPDFWLPHMTAGICYSFSGEYDSGIREFSKALAMNPDSTFAQAGIAMCLAKAGRRAEALRALDRLQAMKDHTYVSPSYVSLVYLTLGDRDAEYAWLEKAYDDRAEFLLWLTVDPIYDGEQKDPRFQAMVRKVGL